MGATCGGLGCLECWSSCGIVDAMDWVELANAGLWMSLWSSRNTIESVLSLKTWGLALSSGRVGEDNYCRRRIPLPLSVGEV